jgi:hypothetical protein
MVSDLSSISRKKSQFEGTLTVSKHWSHLGLQSRRAFHKVFELPLVSWERKEDHESPTRADKEPASTEFAIP